MKTNTTKRPEDYGTRLTDTSRFEPRSFFATHQKLAYFLIVAFMITDAINFYQLFSSKIEIASNKILFLNTGDLLILVISVSFLCIYDLIPYLLGIQYSRKCCGLKVNRRLMWIMLGFVAVGIVLNIVLRVGTRNEIVPATQATLSGEIIEKSDPMALPIALALAFVSIATSITSFYLSYCLNSPLSDDLTKIEAEKKRIEAEIIKLHMILSELETESPKEFANRKAAEDYHLFKTQVYLAIQKTLTCNDEFKHLLMEHLGQPEDYNFIRLGDNEALLEMIREIAKDVGLDSINEIDLLSDTNPGEAFKNEQ